VAPSQKFFIELIHPSRYDDDGYVVQWWRSWTPSNTLACLHGLAADCAARRVLGDEVEIVINAYDEANEVVPVGRIVRRMAAHGGRGVICLAGVQSNQFPRALDLARQFRSAGLPVIVGGFHVSGSLRMLPEMPQDLKEAQAMGVCLFAGEAEGRMDGLLADAYHGRLKPIYNYLDKLPELGGQPIPLLPKRILRRSAGGVATFDTSRGCPFQCKFCTIINVQGRKPRSRTPDDVERIVRAYCAEGIRRFFITDDNFARNPKWEAITDRLIELQEREGIHINFALQIDSTAYNIPRFVEKVVKAGCRWVFIGVESVNAENLASANKRQNHIEEYRQMVRTWHDHGVMVQAGYIIGFPADTPESVRRDVQTLQRELSLDLVKFACLMPLPGSVDHRDKLLAGEWMDPDMNRYTGEKAVTLHARMSRTEWEATLWESWEKFYSYEYAAASMRRCLAEGPASIGVLGQMIRDLINTRYDRVQPLEGGLARRKVRTQRRPCFSRESPWRFYPRRLWEILATALPAAVCAVRLMLLRRRIKYRERPQPGVPSATCCFRLSHEGGEPRSEPAPDDAAHCLCKTTESPP